ncbi:hypothetical protein ACROYT_G018816 [Oculina patagonica]
MAAALEPYRFEPERVPDESQASDDDNEESERLLNLFWCICWRCELTATERESICCREVPETENKFEEGMCCVTEHEEFTVVCLTRAVLRTAIVGFHYLNSTPVPSPMQNRNYRYAAYRQYVWWIYQRLGRKQRRVIPSCVVSAIRREFPEATGNYTGFKDPTVTEFDLAFF